MTNINSMFESIKSALNKNETGGSRFKDILKIEADKTYTVRLLPNVKNPENTFLHYYTFGWKSFTTGQTIIQPSPISWNERCPINEERSRVYVNGTNAEKEKMKGLRRTEQWLVNAYVINDPVNPDNNGKIKVLRYGKQIHKIVHDAIEGEDAEEFGSRIFDLSPAGCNLKVKSEKQGDYPTYVSSKFQSPKEIEGLDAGSYEKVYSGIFDLKTFVVTKSYNELKELLDQHYFCKEPGEAKATTPVATATAKAEPTPNKIVPTTAPIDSNEIDDLLKDL